MIPGLCVVVFVASLNSLIRTTAVSGFQYGRQSSYSNSRTAVAIITMKRNVKLSSREEEEEEGQKQQQQQAVVAVGQNDGTKKEEEEQISNNSITMQPIGQIASVYRLCVGTPRQGLLAPNSRGRIDLNPNRISSDSILDLDQYSHVWVVFVFHLNSNQKQVQRSQGGGATNTTNHGKERQFTSKIAPPALGGKKVGIFATRSPHRPNPIGFTLCKIDQIVLPPKKKHLKQSEQPYSIYVSGLDLVDGTPVLDIKPYVPHYDSVGYPGLLVDSNPPGNNQMEEEVMLPQWVTDGLGKRRPVEFSEKANRDLERIMNSSDVIEMEFYGTHTNRDSSPQDALQKVRCCIEEVLRVDVRSVWQTGKARKGKFQAERAQRVRNVTNNKKKQGGESAVKENDAEENQELKLCTQQLDRLLIQYSVESNKEQKDALSTSIDTGGSGADDMITVRNIDLIPKK